MTHRPASAALKRTVRLVLRKRRGDDAVTADRRAIAGFLDVWLPDRCGRRPCARARACIAPGAPCVVEHRETIRDLLLDLADGPLLADPEAGEAETEEAW
jgi:hypothetical protein